MAWELFRSKAVCWQGLPATHKRFETQQIHWYKLRDGKVVDHYATRDDLGMMKQLGLLPEITHPNTK
jgi:predicted ester cyclase